MNQDIFNDEKVIDELTAKLSEYEIQVRGYEDKMKELTDTLSDLNKKNSMEDISESTKEKIQEVAGKVKDKIDEVDSEIADLNKKIKEINETLNPPPEPPQMPEKEIDELAEMSEKLEKDAKILELENTRSALETKRSQKETARSELETKRSEAETKRNSGDHELDKKIKILVEQRCRLEGTVEAIEEKIGDSNINEATLERLEEMREEVQTKIEELEDKIDELQDKAEEYWDEIIDGINDKIDELNDEIEEINDEIDSLTEKIDGTVDETVINQVKKSSGFDDWSSLLNKITETVNTALFNVNQNMNINIPKIPEIKIPPIPNVNVKIPEIKIKMTKSEPVYNVNFCSAKMGAKISVVCCQHITNNSWPTNVRYGEAKNILNDDPEFNGNWYAIHSHGSEKVVRPHWAIIDFGAVKTFNYLKLVKCSLGRGHGWDTGNQSWNASAWRFEVSSDRENWVEFNRETNDKSEIYEKKFGALTGRYVRLLVDAGGSDPNNKYHGVRFYDLRLEMRDENGNGVNLCKDANIDVCCWIDWRGGEGNPKHLIDDDPEYKTKWFAEYAHEENIPRPHWVVVDLGETRTFNSIRIVKASEGKHDLGDSYKNMSAWRVEVSGDRENWTEFNRETNDQSSVYSKTFASQTGRYIRLLVDAAESDPNNKNGQVRIYDLRLEMLDRKENEGEVTFDDIIAIAPFAKKETLDKLVDKLIVTDDFSKIQALAPFISSEALDRLVIKAASKADFNTVAGLAPFLSLQTLDKIIENLDADVDFGKIHSLAPFLSSDSLVKLIEKNGKVNMNLLKSLAPFLSSDYIDEIISKMM